MHVVVRRIEGQKHKTKSQRKSQNKRAHTVICNGTNLERKIWCKTRIWMYILHTIRAHLNTWIGNFCLPIQRSQKSSMAAMMCTHIYMSWMKPKAQLEKKKNAAKTNELRVFVSNLKKVINVCFNRICSFKLLRSVRALAQSSCLFFRYFGFCTQLT